MPDVTTTTTETVTAPSNSEPPQVRIINARGYAVQIILAQLAELAGLGVVTYALAIGKLSSTEFLGGLAYCLGGNMVGKIRGKAPVPATIAIAVGAPAAVKVGGAAAAAALRHVLAVMLVFMLAACQGCGLFSSGSGPAYEKCATAPARDLVQQVVNILLSGDGLSIGPAEAAALEQLGINYGADALQCALNRAIADLTPNGTAAARPGAPEAAARGKDYLHKRGWR